MLYEEKEKAEIERVYSVFQDYIRTSPYLEWVWSDKIGYILIPMIRAAQFSRYSRLGILSNTAALLRKPRGGFTLTRNQKVRKTPYF